MAIEDHVRGEKLQYDINREADKIAAISSGKIDNYEYLTGEKILLSIKRQITEQGKFNYSSLGRAFEKQVKTIEDQRKTQAEGLENLKPKELKKGTQGTFDDKNDQSRASKIFNDLIEKRKSIMNELEEYILF